VSFLLDTNVISEIRKRRPNPGVIDWFESVDASDLFLSVLVLGEIRQGIARLAVRDPEQAFVYEQWLKQLGNAYADRIIPVSARVADTWGRLNGPNQLPPVDSLLAATALVRDWTLVTRNTANVAGTGARLLNPFTA
jgi:predicted nucleic acid-binding protein